MTRAPYPPLSLRYRGRWRVGRGFPWREWCDGCDATEHVFCLEALPRHLPLHHLGKRRQPHQGRAWGLVCVFSRANGQRTIERA